MFFFFQAEDGIRDLVRSRGLGDVYKRQAVPRVVGVARVVDEVDRAVEAREVALGLVAMLVVHAELGGVVSPDLGQVRDCLLYTSPSPRDRTRSRMPSSA